MKTLSFTHGRVTVLQFETETLRFEPQGESIMLAAEGSITMQDMPSIEYMFAADYPCRLSVTEDGTEIFSGRYLVSLLLLEPAGLAARLKPE